MAAYERQAMRFELTGQSATGLFRAASLELEKGLLAGWHALLPTVLGKGSTACRKIRFTDGGRTRETRADILYQPAPALTLDLFRAGTPQHYDLRVGGTTGLCGAGAFLSFTCRAGVAAEGLCREDLWAFLDWAAMLAAGIEPASGGMRNAVFYIDHGQPSVRVREFRPLECGQARAYLATLCTDLLTGNLDEHGSATGVHPYLLPHEAVLESRRRHTSVSDEIADLCAKAEGQRGRFSSLLGPVPAVLARYAAFPEPEVDAVVQRRFGPIFDLAKERA
jgi:hypothetical protein